MKITQASMDELMAQAKGQSITLMFRNLSL